jgi:RNA recognition motif-containing protein
MKLLVRNLCRSTDHKSLEKLFAEFGAIDSVEIVIDPKTRRSKGFGFVEMNEESALKAIKSLNLSRFQNSTIRVKIANDTSTTPTAEDDAIEDQE